MSTKVRLSPELFRERILAVLAERGKMQRSYLSAAVHCRHAVKFDEAMGPLLTSGAVVESVEEAETVIHGGQVVRHVSTFYRLGSRRRRPS